MAASPSPQKPGTCDCDSVGVLSTEDALSRELDEIESRRRGAGAEVPAASDRAGKGFDGRAERLKLTALCLSGGGIRSAAFCLGTLQALASKGLLKEFDYLSTVSGGGFIGGWLQTRIAALESVGEAEKELAAGTSPQLARLRSFSSYLTPHQGLWSGDVWALVVLYTRNLVLNWMVFGPVFLFLALLPIMYRTLLAVSYASQLLVALALGAATLALLAAVRSGCRMIPSQRTGVPTDYASSSVIGLKIVFPALMWAFLVPFVLAYGSALKSSFPWLVVHWFLPSQTGRNARPVLVLGVVPALYFLIHLLGYGWAWRDAYMRKNEGHQLFRENIIRWCLASFGASLVLWIGFGLMRDGGLLFPMFNPLLCQGTSCFPKGWLIDSASAVTVTAPCGIFLGHVVQTTFYVGLRRAGLQADLDREWLARVTALGLRIAVAWMLLAACVVFGPTMLSLVDKNAQWWATGIALSAGGSGALGASAAYLGKGMVAGFEALGVQSGFWKRLTLVVLSALFAFSLLVVAGSLGAKVVGRSGKDIWLLFSDCAANVPSWYNSLVLLLAIALLAAIVWGFGYTNINRFSLHAIYRNRLVRAFLGSARLKRDPDPLTGFDREDNRRVAELLKTYGQRLFPVINATLNVTSGSDQAMAERQGESFTATPLFCGSAALFRRNSPSLRRNGRSSTWDVGSESMGAFVPTRCYAGMESRGDARSKCKGIYLGGMLTISGAAVSPNWGYHTSSAIALLLTLFNARLGAWLPNPAMADPDQLQRAMPAHSLLPMFEDLFGIASNDRQAVYLSDGGHFENLGLYEMLRRRCRYIVVIDAGQDKDFAFFDLGNAIRKAATDLHAEVRITTDQLICRKDIGESSAAKSRAIGFAVGEIVYQCGATGTLLYLKPSYLPDIPEQVRAYGAANHAFPHEPTLDQWFTESQFESYRALGRWQMEQLTGRLHELTLGALFREARRASIHP